jgi:hypothetical protein
MSSSTFLEDLIELIIKWLRKILPPQYFQTTRTQTGDLKMKNYNIYFIKVLDVHLNL